MMNDELNAEHSEAVERHEVLLEFLIATSWCSSTSLHSVFNSRFAAFKRCFTAFKDLTAFDLQSQICGFQWVISFLNTA
jgi:hypothetical protein